MPKTALSHRQTWGVGRLLLPLVLVLFGLGCASLPNLPELKPMQHVPPTLSTVSIPPPISEPSTPRSHLQATLQRPSMMSTDALPGVSPALQDTTASTGLTLAQLVDEALRINPITQHAWEHARVSATNWALSLGNYYPTITGTAFGGVAEADGQSVKGIDVFDRQAFGGVALSLDYLLLDFGVRSAEAEAARQGLIAAKWNHNQAIQDVLRDVTQAYYTLLGAKAHLAATEISLADAQTGLDAAQARLKTGVGTLPEKLQAQARVERVRFERQTASGQVEIARGKLATSVGWPANTPLTVAAEPDSLPLNAISQNVEQLIEQAQQNRPDLAAFRAAITQQEAEVRKARSAHYPTMTATATAGWTTVNGFTVDGDDDLRSYAAGLEISVPIFQGFVRRNTVRKAVAELDIARTAFRIQAETVIEDVWEAHHHFRTASQQIKASQALLASSAESYKAALERYQVGGGDIVELLNHRMTSPTLGHFMSRREPTCTMRMPN